jgi:hypothetical protein
MNRLLIVTTLVIFTVPPYAHGQEPNAAILKAEAQKVVSLISGDKLKTQTYCEIGDLSEQLDQPVRCDQSAPFPLILNGHGGRGYAFAEKIEQLGPQFLDPT